MCIKYDIIRESTFRGEKIHRQKLIHLSGYLVTSINRTLHDNADRRIKTRRNLKQLKGFLKHNKGPNRLAPLLFWPLESPKYFHVAVFFRPCPSAPHLLEPEEPSSQLLIKGPASPATNTSDTSNAAPHYQHRLISIRSHLAFPAPNQTRQDKVSGAAEKESEDARNISRHYFFKGLTSNASVIHFTTGVVLESDFELFPSTMAEQ